MALNVKFLKGTAAKYQEYIAQSKIEATTFYYIDEKDLYLGLVKLSNGADVLKVLSLVTGVNYETIPEALDVPSLSALSSASEKLGAVGSKEE